MSPPLEQDYIERIPSSSSSSNTLWSDDEKKTELRLGLPGSESPERKTGLCLFGKDLDLEDNKNNGVSLSSVKSSISGAKRGFSDAIDGSGKWGFSIMSSRGSDALDFGKVDPVFAPRGGGDNSGGAKNINTLQSCLPGPEVGPPPASKPVQENKFSSGKEHGCAAPASKAQVVGWPPIRSFRKNTLATNLSKSNDVEGKSEPSCLYVKVSMDGAPYLRKVDLKIYFNYAKLSSALEKMFSGFTSGKSASDDVPEQEMPNERGLKDTTLHSSEYVLTYEDKDGDWMLVGDVPWEMFICSCKRLRILRGSEATGLAPKCYAEVQESNLIMKQKWRVFV